MNDDFKRVFDAAVTARSADAIETAPREEDEPLLLFCPEHGGWRIGVLFEGHWLGVADAVQDVRPRSLHDILPSIPARPDGTGTGRRRPLLEPKLVGLIGCW